MRIAHPTEFNQHFNPYALVARAGAHCAPALARNAQAIAGCISLGMDWAIVGRHPIAPPYNYGYSGGKPVRSDRPLRSVRDL